MKVSTGSQPNPLFDTFIQAGQQAGYPFTADMNGYQQEGFGKMDMTIHQGERWSAAKAYLKPIRSRPNLTVETGALSTRILFEGTRAVGVEYAQAGQVRVARAAREVILCGGAINSPQLLMLSGVGPADQLRRHGIAVVHDLPGVGRNLQDHLEMYIQYECTKPITLYSVENPLYKARVGVEWFLFRSGLTTSAHLEAGGFIRSRAGIRHPDIQYHFLPSVVNDHGRQPGDRHAFQARSGRCGQQRRHRAGSPPDASGGEPSPAPRRTDRRETASLAAALSARRRARGMLLLCCRRAPGSRGPARPVAPSASRSLACR